MKTMTLEELKKRGLNVGDIAFFTTSNRWGIVNGERSCEHINFHSGSVWISYNHMLKSVTKVIFREDWTKQDPIKIMKLFRGCDNYIFFPITRIIDKRMAKYIHGVHFGSSKLYTWRVPDKLAKVDFKPGDIVEVDTMYGKQYVQVKEVSEHDYYGEFKEVINLIKADEIPF